jgi:hypothetical protein
MFEQCKREVKRRSNHGTEIGCKIRERMGMHFRLKTAGFCCCVLMLGQLAFAAPKRHKVVQQPAPAPVQEAPPPVPQPPPTPEQMPPVAPKVTMHNGLLSIQAENSSLGDILNAVRQQTGAGLEAPPAIANERVATSLGPGAPKDVLQDLLAGSRFDYIIVGAPQNPDIVQRIIVTMRSGGPNPGPSVANNAPPQNTYQSPDDVNQSYDEEPQPEPAPPEPPQQQQQQQPVTPPNGGQPYSNQPKTPEQLLQELQQMQQQQQQRPPRNPQ